MPKITGIVRVTVNGTLLESLPGAELDLGGFEREEVTGHTFYGTREKYMAAKLTCTIVWKSDTPVEDLRSTVDGTGVFESDAGVAYTVDNLTIKSPVILKGETGEVPLEFVGAAAKPV